VRSLAKRRAEEAMEVEFGQASLARRLLQQNPRLIFGGEKIASTTEPAESVVMEKLRHEGNDTSLPAVNATRESTPRRLAILPA